MKISLLIFLLAFQSLSSLSQDISDRASSNDGHYLVVKAGYENRKQTLSKGDKIVVKLKSKKKLACKIVEINPDYFVADSGDKIAVSDIQWIKKYKLSSTKIALGLTVLTAGLITVFVITPTVDFDVINQVGFLGIGLTTAGIAILATRPKYNPGKGDKLIYKELTN